MEAILKLKKRAFFITFLLIFIPFLTYGEAINNSIDKKLMRVATNVDWPTNNLVGSYEVLIQDFFIDLPEGPKRISTVNDSLIIFSKDGSVLHFDPISASDLNTPAYPTGITIDSKITVSEAGQIPFVKNINDPTPTEPADLAVWQDAMENKKTIFGNSNEVCISRKENLIVYYYESPVPPLGNYASVHDLNKTESFLHITAQNMKFEEFKKIIGSIHLR